MSDKTPAVEEPRAGVITNPVRCARYTLGLLGWWLQDNAHATDADPAALIAETRLRLDVAEADLKRAAAAEKPLHLSELKGVVP